ncbi:MAG: uridine kinase family protein [Candidatus Merdivicinus sp.]|jgi:uridine kinase
MVSDRKKQIEFSELIAEAADPAGLAARSETYYREQAKQVADLFCEKFPQNQVILLAGPSSSGKTTTSLNLQHELQKRGIFSLSISLDDFFKEREAAPLLEDGSPDLETVELVDLEFLDACFEKLFSYGSCDFPIFDFAHGRRSENVKPCQLDEHTAVIIEGLHALNPLVCSRKFCKNALKIYISIKTEFFDGSQRLFSTRELRLVRRIIRDYNFRSTSPADTMAMWKNVVRGEDHYIRPFRLDADYWLDSVHYYEPFVYRDIFLNLTQDALWKDTANREIMEKMRENMRKFPAISTKYVPKDSLLREFIILP